MPKIIIILYFFLSCIKTNAQVLSVLSATNPVCIDQMNGSITFSINGTAFPYTATVSGICISSTPIIISGITSNTFTVTGLGNCNAPFPHALSGEYIVSLSNNTNSVIASITIYVAGVYFFALASSTANISCYNAADAYINTYLYAYGNPVPVSPSYLWSTATNTNYATTPNISNVPPGTYSLTVTDVNGCVNSNSASITFTNPTPVVLSHSLNQPATPSCCNGNITFSASGGTPGGASSYTFSTVPAIASYTSVCQGTYTLTAADNNNCKNSYSLSVSCITSIKESELESSGFTLYPNPTNGRFTIELSDEKRLPTFISIQTAMGEEIIRLPIDTPKMDIYVQELPPGIYFIKVLNKKVATPSKKLIIN
ncbi:MAG: T9SS type A sorting domain-containing protein [Bacteroidetes bacterium]|nr:T9SS type A sorting domain-containing protein [Bacteroidota bacterium]